MEPDWKYPAYADTRAAWTGVLPDRPDMPIHIEAAAWQGKPVYWRLVSRLWESPSTVTTLSLSQRIAGAAFIILLNVSVLGCGAFFARRNLRMGRGHRRGAARLACFVSCLLALSWIFGQHHVDAFGEIILLLFPITTRLSAWYSGIGLTGLAPLFAFALYAFHTSLGGQPLFRRASLGD